MMSKKATETVIRPAKRDDIPGIVEVWRTSVSDEEVAGFGTPLSESPYRDVETLSSKWTDPNRMGSEEVIVAEIDGTVVGCVTVEDRGSSLELTNIDVLGERQRRGIGTQIVGFVEDLARRQGKDAVTLGTSRSAAGVPWRSLPWWQARGYHITHEEENDWSRSIGPGAKEIRMMKCLGTSPANTPDL